MSQTVWIVIAIVAGVIILTLILLFVFGKGNAVKAFFDFILTRIKLLLATFGLFNIKNLLPHKDDTKVKELEQENDRIRKELEKLRNELKEIDERVKKEREAHEAEIKRFEALIAQKEKERAEIEANINKLRSQTTMQWFNSLPKAEQDRLKEEIRKDIKWEP